jgi:hypothetical protein
MGFDTVPPEFRPEIPVCNSIASMISPERTVTGIGLWEHHTALGTGQLAWPPVQQQRRR